MAMEYAFHKDSIEGAQPSFFIIKTASLKYLWRSFSSRGGQLANGDQKAATRRIERGMKKDSKPLHF